jgi:outer membrane protein OmpA-like peptidoglycan-associated protein
MNAFLATTCIVTGALLAGGCATKKYVQNTAAPIQAKVDQVGEQTSRNGQQIEDTRSQVKQNDEKAQSGIGAAQERAATADQLDDYKLQTSVAVAFSFDKYELSADGKAELDKLAAEVKSGRRFFIAVEGYTDSTGSKMYNETLSRRRADRVVEYLVAKHDIPIYRIHTIGLGQEKPVDDAKNRTARAKNRRVEVKVFSADQAIATSANATNTDTTTTTPAAKQ